jgi:tol-pal system protein YbgF
MPPPMDATAAAAAAEEAGAEKTEEKTATTDAPTKPPEAKTLGTISSSGKTGDAQGLYDQAFLALRQAKYDDAERDFKSFLKANPKHRLTENAKYWLAETYYVRGKYSDSAVLFAETYQEFPQGAKAPDNLLKLAMSLAGLKKTQDACLTLGELKKRFPTTSAGIKNRAEQEKKTLGCTA